MDDEADAAREYDRLRAELADFVLDAVAERIAEGRQPELSQALVEAIDRRVDHALATRIGSSEFPDPDAFADAVIAAAAGRSGAGGDRYDAASTRARRNSEGDRGGRSDPQRSRGLSGGQIALIALIGIAILAAAGYFLLRGGTPATNTQVVNVVTNTLEPTPDGAVNAQQPPPPGGTAAPTSAGAPENVQGQPR